MPMKFGNPQGTVPKPTGKGIGQALLPNKAALAKLTKGDPAAQSISNYAKAVPSGAAAMTQTYPQIMAQGEQGVKVE